MKYKIIAMDFDGTLLTSDKKISSNTRNILKKCQDNDYLVVGVTARNLRSAQNVVDPKMFDYIILNNGAFLLDVKTDTVKSFGAIKPSDLRKIEEIFANTSAKCEYVSLTKYYIEGADDPLGIRVNIASPQDIKEEVSRMNVYLSSEEKLEKYKKILTDSIKNINVVSMKDTDKKNTMFWLNINEKNSSKLLTLQKLADSLSISLDEVIFFGDGENDLSLLENVGMGVAMGNAINSVKEKSKEITLSNDEEGVYNFLQKYLVMK